MNRIIIKVNIISTRFQLLYQKLFEMGPWSDVIHTSISITMVQWLTDTLYMGDNVVYHMIG